MLLLLACEPGSNPGNPSLLQGLGGDGGGTAKGGSNSRGGSDPGKGGTGGSGGGKGGSEPGKGGTGGTGGFTTGGTGGGAGNAIAGLNYPLTLTPLTNPQTSTANLSLFFAVTDAAGQPVTKLGSDDFEVREDGAPLPKNESDFQAAPLSGQTLDVPTVLLLDLSGSIVSGGAIEKLKQAATAIVDGALPEQRLSIVSFADQSKVRVDFTKDKVALKAAIAAIKDKDGLSTNLYGAVADALGRWQDGFVGAGSTGRLTTGLVLVMTDGTDTAGLRTLGDVVQQRGNKRIITVGIGNEVNVDALSTLGNAGYLASTSFDALVTDVGKINAATQALGKSIYRASYCSPKLAGQHELLFYPKGNPAPSQGGFTCNQPQFGEPSQLGCKDAGYVPCGTVGSKSGCCPSGNPFLCASTNKCYETAEAASQACSGSSSCVTCQVPKQGGVSLQSGPYLELEFNASGHNTKQCPASWGVACKALAECCNAATESIAQSCASDLVQLQGEESGCTQRKNQYCPTLGTKCQVAKACCDSLGSASQRDNCLSQVNEIAADGNDAQCDTISKQQCPTYGPQCAQYKACCEARSEPEDRESCLQLAKGYAVQPNGENVCKQRYQNECLD